MFYRFVYLLLYIFYQVNCKIEIKDANVAALSRDDIGMIFYITVQNTDVCSYDVKVNMIECTEIIEERDRDSEFMYLIGGHMGYLKPKCYKNITVLYPNMYLHNRRGFCIISLKFKSDEDRITQKKANITFDTWITRRGTPSIMRGYYTKNEVRKCQTVDQDPLSKCKAVDCHMKYLGTRNFFNKRWQRCQKVPICIADATKEMPDVIYTPSNNKCRDMERSVTKTDLQQIESGTLKGPCEEKYHNLLNVDCHFGKLNNITGLCECDNGWISVPIDKDQSDTANLFIFHMCNIEVGSWYDTSSQKIKVTSVIIGILSVVIAMTIIIISFLINQCYNCIKSFETHDEDVEQEVKPSRKERCKKRCEKRKDKSKSSRTSTPSSTTKSTRTSKQSEKSEPSTQDINKLSVSDGWV